MPKDKPLHLQPLRTCASHMTWWIGERAPRLVPLVYVIGYPKSGTTWVAQMVADYLQLPFPRGSILPVGFPAVMHAHRGFPSGKPRVVYVMRDGRDALTSLYFFESRRMPEGDHPRMTRLQRRLYPGMVNKADVRTNIGPFVSRQLARPHASPLNWGDHVRTWLGASDTSGSAMVRYEDMRASPVETLTGAMRAITGKEPEPELIRMAVEKFSFRRQSKRSPGEEDRTRLLRKGESGDWRNHFTPEAARAFDRVCGDALIEAGYETDHRWVERVAG